MENLILQNNNDYMRVDKTKKGDKMKPYEMQYYNRPKPKKEEPEQRSDAGQHETIVVPEKLEEALSEKIIPFIIIKGAGEECYLNLNIVGGCRFEFFYEDGWGNDFLSAPKNRSLNEIPDSIQKAMVNLRNRIEKDGVRYNKNSKQWTWV